MLASVVSVQRCLLVYSVSGWRSDAGRAGQVLAVALLSLAVMMCMLQ